MELATIVLTAFCYYVCCLAYRNTPQQIGTDNTWVSIAAGGGHTIALKSDGTLWAWGHNVYGGLGDCTLANRWSPVQITGTCGDTIPPVITITGVSNGATYALGLAPTASYTVTDALSGVATSSASLTGGDGLGLGLGAFTYIVTASDNAGNTITASATYNVIATTNGLNSLIQQILASGQIDNTGMANSLLSKVVDAANAAARGNGQASDNIMQAFINQVSAQSGQHISASAAAMLINAAMYIINN